MMHSVELRDKYNEIFESNTITIENYVKKIDGILPSLKKAIEAVDNLPVFKYLQLNKKEIFIKYMINYQNCESHVDKNNLEKFFETVNTAVYESQKFAMDIYTCHDEIYYFKMYAETFVNEYIDKIERKNAPHYAKAINDFLNNTELQNEIEKEHPKDEINNIFKVQQPVNIEYVSIPNPDNQDEFIIAEKMVFRSLGGFLNADFYHALSVGNFQGSAKIAIITFY